MSTPKNSMDAKQFATILETLKKAGEQLALYHYALRSKGEDSSPTSEDIRRAADDEPTRPNGSWLSNLQRGRWTLERWGPAMSDALSALDAVPKDAIDDPKLIQADRWSSRLKRSLLTLKSGLLNVKKAVVMPTLFVLSAEWEAEFDKLAEYIRYLRSVETAEIPPAKSGHDDDTEWSKATSPSDAAKLFGVSARTFLRRVEEGKIRAKKLSSKSYQIALDDLPTHSRK